MELYRTDRFVIRKFRVEDAPAYANYRNDESTAEYQSWSLPYSHEKAEAYVNEFIAMDGLTEGKFYCYAIADPQTDELIGDIGFRSEWNGRSVELGYNLALSARGRGIATGAGRWLISRAFNELNVLRIEAALHPDNLASMMVLERLGFIYEGTARQSYWVDDVCTDDPRFGLLRQDWDAWNARVGDPVGVVQLAEITASNRDAVFALRTHKSQERFVSPMAQSAIDALVPDLDDGLGRLIPWMRAVLADGEIVGFVMVAAPTATNPHPFLWRFLIDRIHQRRGIGTKVLDLLVDRWRNEGADQLLVSWKPGRGSPEPLYLGYGFRLTGEEADGEVVASLRL
jgi:RimJ/RimL family protein N-acetyltransferase